MGNRWVFVLQMFQIMLVIQRKKALKQGELLGGLIELYTHSPNLTWTLGKDGLEKSFPVFSGVHVSFCHLTSGPITVGCCHQ